MWALGAAAAVSLTTHALLSVLVAAVAGAVALRRRPADGARRTWWLYAGLGAAIVVVRVVFQALLGVNRSGAVLFTLPRVPLPDWAAGIRLGGPVTTDGLALALGDGARLAAIVMCVGAAAVLASPRRALRTVPAALGEVTTALAIALTVAPQLLDSAARVRRARRLRGGPPGRLRLMRTVVLPVFGDAVDRSVSIAAAMEARGYGATLDARRVPPATTALTATALALLGFGAFAVLGLPGAGATGTACLVAGTACAAGAVTLARRRLAVTRYRPTEWTRVEWALAATGAATFAVAAWALATATSVMRPTTPPWPAPTLAMLAVPALAASALLWTPAPAPEATR
ncbi:CbiQ family ECF transporter T component [Xylanimonas ulmi]|uniref:Energy-coupling factor transport system permease protein n=1 Tax=Xylanimonas ulmi TaxID=228973 RepID=A0A4Q7M016_9MICO|nr:energy-coupling factor transport system permease protein [Xylanibacterium ulmi]